MGNRAMLSIQAGFSGRERSAIVQSAAKLGYDFVWEDKPSEGTIPVGSVEYCEPLFGDHYVDFYPEFLSPWFHRTILGKDGPWTSTMPWFVKRREVWKDERFHARVFTPGEVIPAGGWWISSPVEFTQEWRYYIADGEAITTGWYAGKDDDEPAPQLDVWWPKGFSGAVDFGRLRDGRMALVECHAPFACGWYGDRHEDYAFWQIFAWETRGWWTQKRKYGQEAEEGSASGSPCGGDGSSAAVA